jgi:deoxyribonuclease IV
VGDPSREPVASLGARKDHLPILIGAHISIAGGFDAALHAGKAIGATTIQIFTANQRQWAAKPLQETEIQKFKKALVETGLSHITAHDSYLINLGSPNTIVREKSIAAFRKEIERCLSLGISYLNFHPGAALEGNREECLLAIADALRSMQGCFASGKDTLILLLEITAGQGSVVGSSFDELDFIIEQVKGKVPVGVCLDTCHTFASGYDLRSKETFSATLDQFDKIIGLKHLHAMHLNDSEGGLGSHKDRHSPIGEGMIGSPGFSAIMKEPRVQKLPKYLETPGGLEIWKKEIAWLKMQV